MRTKILVIAWIATGIRLLFGRSGIEDLNWFVQFFTMLSIHLALAAWDYRSEQNKKKLFVPEHNVSSKNECEEEHSYEKM